MMASVCLIEKWKKSKCWIGIFVLWAVQVCRATDTFHSKAHHEAIAAATGGGLQQHDDSALYDDGYWKEIKAIVGGVLGFWGGVGSLGTIFLVVVLSQRYCCRLDEDKDDADG